MGSCHEHVLLVAGDCAESNVREPRATSRGVDDIQLAECHAPGLLHVGNAWALQVSKSKIVEILARSASLSSNAAANDGASTFGDVSLACINLLPDWSSAKKKWPLHKHLPRGRLYIASRRALSTPDHPAAPQPSVLKDPSCSPLQCSRSLGYRA